MKIGTPPREGMGGPEPDGITYGYRTATDPAFGDSFILWTQGPSYDTTPSFGSGQVKYTGSGRVLSNAPVVKH